MKTALFNHFNQSREFYLVIVGMDGYYKYVNPLFKNTFSFLGPNFESIKAIDSFHPDDAEICQIAANNAITNPNKAFEVTLRKPTEKGNYFYTFWEFSAHITDENGLEGLLCIGYDATHKQQQSENVIELKSTLQAMSDTTTDMNILLSKNYLLISFNKKASDFTLQTTGRLMKVGDDFRTYLLEPTDESFHRQFNSAVSGKRSLEEIKIVATNGNELWYRGEMNPIYNETGTIVGVSLNSTDITHIQKTRKILDEISWIQSHEIRRPVANILGLVKLLQENKLNEESREILNHLLTSCQEMDDQIKKIVNKTYQF